MKVSLFQGVLMGIFGIGAFVGLFVFATYSSSSKGGDTIGTVLIWGTLPKEGIKETLTESKKINQTLKGVSYVQKNPATLPNDLATAIATGKAPDLVLASQEELKSLSQFISPIPSSSLSVNTFQNTFVGGANIFALSGGAGYFGIPFLVDPLVLFSNNSILSSDNIAQPPATWESLIGLVPNVSILTPSRQITRGLIALGTYRNVHDARGILSALFLQTGIPLVSRSSTGQLSVNLGQSSVNGTPLGQAVIRFYTQFADPSKVSYTWNASLPDSQSVFLAGNLALYLGYVSESRFLTAANPNLNFTVSPLPQPATAKTKRTYGRIFAFMIPRGAKNASGAYKTMVLLSNKNEQTIAASATGLAPAVRSAFVVAPTDSVSAVAYSSALYTQGWLSPLPLYTDQVFSSMIRNVISGRTTLDTALLTAEHSLSAFLQ